MTHESKGEAKKARQRAYYERNRERLLGSKRTYDAARPSKTAPSLLIEQAIARGWSCTRIERELGADPEQIAAVWDYLDELVRVG